MVQATGLVTVESERTVRGSARRKIRNEIYLVADPDTLRWLSARNEALELLCPDNLPMVVPPLPWRPGERGGYRFALRGKYPLVRGISSSHRAKVEAADMPLVYQALNAIQATAWRINPAVLDLV